ncbi:periplasmic heavy metal sensor [Congregibacter litoralis]|uniref:Signaling pathway modulator ZraP n=1 Tax=Congregibacter litoralis KT71 TaxID=314285 RepID=A4ABH6_9GAMM|nr:periplasmic heavy metal sensor [Congregibacter litoralis]EAQ96730.1 putative integral membrane protein [Congregibacter litoralis KT71]
MKKSNLVVIALLLSVATNLLIAGFFIGKTRGPVEPPPMAWMAEEMAPETRRMVRRQMREQFPQVRPLREEMRRAQGAVREAVSAEDFDPEALASALERSREVSARYQALIHKNLIDISADLPREQRMALARAALERGQRAKRPHRPPENIQ